MKFLIGATIVFLVQYGCFYLLKTLEFPFPAPILGIIVLFVLLKTGLIKEEFVESFCNFCLKYMILFFIPLFVGLIAYIDIISKNFLSIILTIFITTTLTMVFVGLFVETAIKYKRLYSLKRNRKL